MNTNSKFVLVKLQILRFFIFPVTNIFLYHAYLKLLKCENKNPKDEVKWNIPLLLFCELVKAGVRFQSTDGMLSL
jgi:hypothetical protein